MFVRRGPARYARMLARVTDAESARLIALHEGQSAQDQHADLDGGRPPAGPAGGPDVVPPVVKFERPGDRP